MKLHQVPHSEFTSTGMSCAINELQADGYQVEGSQQQLDRRLSKATGHLLYCSMYPSLPRTR